MNLKDHTGSKHLMSRYVIFLALCLFSILYLATDTFAAIPLITDDTGTQGKGKFQFELFGEYGHDKKESVTNKNSDFSATLTYGIIDSVDMVLSIPYQAWNTNDSESETKGNGLSDLAIETKWRFYEKDGFSLALKPGFTIPTGDEEKDLGNGKMTYYLYFIASKEMDTKAFHFNLAYIRNENKVMIEKTYGMCPSLQRSML